VSNPFATIFDGNETDWDTFTSMIATTDDIRMLLWKLNEQASFGPDSEWAMKMYLWVMAMTNHELIPEYQSSDKGDK
jgi:hypothetical protein